MKLNTQNMLQTFTENEWYSIDLIMDYDDQRVSIYVNDKPLKSASFFTQSKDKLASGNAVSIYGLTPDSNSQFRNVMVCETLCGEQAAKDIEYGNLSGSYAYGFSMVVGLSSLLVSLLA